MSSKLVLSSSASLVAMLLSVAAMGQQPALNFPIAESLDVGSPEVVSGERDPGGIVMVASTTDFDGANLIRASDLGLPVDF
ncbi:MAG TPA: hypothetical protein ENK43_09955, partial [Planctomycetes bacterium]|nr:hypothetical protein [Planctomycetota bacterium]